MSAPPPPMDPRYEQWLRDEVIYLHSLWHQGPPPPPHATVFRHDLHPNQSTRFKKQKTHNKNKLPINSSPGKEWPCPPTPPPISDNWPPFPNPPQIDNSSVKLKPQTNALQIARKFLRVRDDSDSDEIGSESSGDESMELEGGDGSEEYEFFFNLLMGDDELKEYYVKNYVQGEFSCLVCGALGGKKMGKKYGGCMALVQHSVSISKTKRRRAHRAFGQAVCKVLGWDIDQLPTIVSLLSETKVNADLAAKESNVELTGDVVSLPSEHASSDVQVNVDLANKDTSNLTSPACNMDSGKDDSLGVVAFAASGAAVSFASEHTSGDLEGNVCRDDKEATACNVPAAEDNIGGLVSQSVVGSLLNELTSGDTQNDNSDNKESLVAVVCNVDPVEGDISVIVPESGANVSGASPSSDYIGEAAPDENNGAGKPMPDLHIENAAVGESKTETENTMDSDTP